MAPHKALTVPDILYEVFGHLSARPQLSLPDAELGSFPGFPSAVIDGDDFEACKTKRMTLARAARTCKAFAEPASRTLWEVLDSLAPIISILKNARTSEGEGKTRTHLWERFEQIARRIRALSCRGLSRGDVLSPICSRYDGRPIFPNLRVLSLGWGFHGAPYLAFLKAVCASPTLVLFAITTEYELATPEILATVADAHQELIHLKAPFLRNFNQEIHRALAKFTNLHTAHISTIDTSLFRHLAALPNLRTLGGRFDTSKPIMNIPGAFPALQELSTEDINDGTDFRAVLPVLSSKSLVSLSLCISVPLTEDMLDYLDELCSSPSLSHLRKLDLRVDIEFNQFFDQFHNQDEPFEGVTFADVLALLKRLPGLRDISAVITLLTSTVASFDMNDKDLDAVASAWPNLTRVKLGHAIDDDGNGGPWGPGIARPSLSAVVSLAERCRGLESVDIEFESVDASELARLEARADAPCASPQTELRRIVFEPYHDILQKLHVADPSRLAAALHKLFPSLVGGLEMLEEEPGVGEASVTYRDWPSSERDTDAFRLLKALDDLHLDGRL